MVRRLPHLNGITHCEGGSDKSRRKPGLSCGPDVSCGAQVSGKLCCLSGLEREVRPTDRNVANPQWTSEDRLKSLPRNCWLIALS